MANPPGSKLNIFSWYELADDAMKFLCTQNSPAHVNCA